MESFQYTIREPTPEEAAERAAYEARIAGYRPEPDGVYLRVGEVFNGVLRLIPFDVRGRPLPWRSNAIAGIVDEAVAKFDKGRIVGVAPGRTQIKLMAVFRTASGERPDVYVDIIVRTA